MTSEPGWPHRRGPRYDAVSDETDLADTWPPEGPPVLWTRDLGQGYSGFTAMGDRVFTQTQPLVHQSVVCLDADTGDEIWRYNYALPHEAMGMYPGPMATPTWHRGHVYFAGPRGLVGCLRADDGSHLWSRNLKEEYDGQGTDFGYACSPVVEGDLVILPVGGVGASVVALDADDGTTVWASGDRPASYCDVLPITLRGRRYVVAYLQNSLAVLDLATGGMMWEEVFNRGYDEHAAAPLYREPLLMVASPFRAGADCWRLTPVDEQGNDVADRGTQPKAIAAKPAWFNREFSHDTASSVLVDGHAYGFDLRDIQAKAHRPSRGTFRCLDFTNGRTVWSTDRVGHATVIAADGKLVLFNDCGELLLARASPTR